jgi:hypothetical protein
MDERMDQDQPQRFERWPGFFMTKNQQKGSIPDAERSSSHN